MSEPALSSVNDKFLSLKEAAEILQVSIETLLEWNNSNILKPTITQNGDVGYYGEQIDKFLAIQRPVTTERISPVTPLTDQVIQNISGKTPAPKQIADDLIPVLNTPDKTKEVKTVKYWTLPTFAVVIILILTMLFTKQDRTDSSTNSNIFPSPEQSENLNRISKSQISEAELTDSSPQSITVQLNNNNSYGDNLNNGISTNSGNILAAAFLNFESDSAIDSANIYYQDPFINVLGLDNEYQDYDISANTASRPGCPTCFVNKDTTTIEESGNLKEDNLSNNPLSSTLSTTGLVQGGTSFKQSVYSNILLTLLALGFFAAFYAFTQQPAYAGGKDQEIPDLPLNPLGPLNIQKVLEIDQKPDGSVVLLFQGAEHKISKPELNSETDQFIQRLLVYASNDVKEINYNSMKDDKLRLNAPLSKLVTRLGFVGLKRDLFFPRTSKNRVIFRRFLTYDDLTSLGLTPNQISTELLN